MSLTITVCRPTSSPAEQVGLQDTSVCRLSNISIVQAA